MSFAINILCLFHSQPLHHPVWYLNISVLQLDKPSSERLRGFPLPIPVCALFAPVIWIISQTHLTCLCVCVCQAHPPSSFLPGHLSSLFGRCKTYSDFTSSEKSSLTLPHNQSSHTYSVLLLNPSTWILSLTWSEPSLDQEHLKGQDCVFFSFVPALSGLVPSKQWLGNLHLLHCR